MRGILKRNCHVQYLIEGQSSVKNLRNTFARLAFDTLFFHLLCPFRAEKVFCILLKVSVCKDATHDEECRGTSRPALGLELDQPLLREKTNSKRKQDSKLMTL